MCCHREASQLSGMHHDLTREIAVVEAGGQQGVELHEVVTERREAPFVIVLRHPPSAFVQERASQHGRWHDL